jgi:hypothetical protein
MDDLRALRPVLYLVALGAGCLLALQLLIASGFAEPFVPRPDTTAEELVKAIGAHRYEAAIELLAEDLAGEVDVDDLRGLAERVEAARGGIEQATGEGDETSGDAATASVKVRLGDRTEETIEFPLAREGDLWKVAALDPLESLAE